MALGGIQFTWLGHSAWDLRSQAGVRLLVDPFLSGNPKTPEDRKTVDAVDVVLVTHGHVDHTGDVLEIAGRLKPTVVTAVEIGSVLEARGIENVTSINKGGSTEVRGIRFTGTTAEHTGSIQLDGEVVGYCEPMGWMITFEDGFRVYHAGDTSVFGDMALLGELYRPDVAILPIGDHFTMGPFEAAHAVRLLGVQHVLPTHWGTFPALTGTPDALRRELGKLGLSGVTVHDLAPGATLS
jgi:L-ascorbate metabolism protein UlaG (beta-lactamase superfamily)